MTEGKRAASSSKTSISLYEFYALGIERLIERAPWELERAVSKYHERFLVEQRCLGLAILLLIGEEQVPQALIRDQAMPGFEDQTRSSVNQAVFLRALRHYFVSKQLNQVRADMVLERMHSYVQESREASKQDQNPLNAMLHTMICRVPPQDETQRQQYATRVEKIYDYIEGLVEGSLLKRYAVTT